MIKKTISVERHHTRDYEIVTDEKMVREYYLFGKIRIFRWESNVNNYNDNAVINKRVSTGFKRDEKSN